MTIRPKQYSPQPINPEWYLPVEPRPKQWEAHAAACAHIRSPLRTEPGFIYASVGFGKTINIAMIAKQAQQVAINRNTQQLKILVIARTGDLIDQNSEEMWKIGARNSIFSASLGIKSTRYDVIAGTEGTVARSLGGQLKNINFDLMLVDEAYQLDYENPDCQYMQLYSELKARNPKLIIIGYGGSMYRGQNLVIGKFWKHLLYSCSMWEAIDIGICTPIVFGFGDSGDKKTEYTNLDDIKPSGVDGTDDLSKELMAAQNKIITQQKDITHHILDEVAVLASTRNCVLITCAGKRHIDQCIEILHLIHDCCDYTDINETKNIRYAVVTEKTKTKERKIIKDLCNSGKIKYVFQIGAWTVGVNVPMFDTIVILRRIGSRTLLEQLVGRGIRWLRDAEKALGFFKYDCLCLDYAGTFEAMGEFFDDQFIQTAQAKKAEKNQDTIACGRERCGATNSAYARRCLGKDMQPNHIPKLAPDPRGRLIPEKLLFIIEPDGRCGHFWSKKVCPICTTPNDKAARSCRRCDAVLIDPNAKLTGTHYTDADFKPVLTFNMTLTSDKKGLLVFYDLPDGETAKEIFYPQHENKFVRDMFCHKFVSKHLHISWHQKTKGKTAMQLLAMKAIFDVPVEITHRINEKGDSVITRKKFKSGRETNE